MGSSVAPRIRSSSSQKPSTVSISCRPSGAIVSAEMSRRPEIDMCSVRGIGVAERVSRSISARSFLKCSLCATPKRCSSSTTTRPSRLKPTSFDRMRCVPIRMSTSPRATFSSVALPSADAV
jgi:hypothetical protein